MTSADICILIAIFLYLLFVLGIGVWSVKHNHDAGDYYLGGRRLGALVTAMSAEASDMSSWLLMGLPGVAYLYGLADATWTAIGLAVGTYLNWLIVAKRLRRYTAVAGNAVTLPEFFSNRFGDKQHILSMIAALVIIIFFVPYTASGFAACGKLFSSLFGWDYVASMLISAVVIVGYTAMGGFLAASTTDFVQSIIMTIALIVVLFFGVSVAGGFDSVFDNASRLPGYLSLVGNYDPVTGENTGYGFITIFSTLAWGLGYFGMPHVLLRFMAVSDSKKLTLSRRIASIWVVISMSAAILIGVIGLGMTNVGAVPALEGSASETIIVQIADLLSQHGALCALLAGVILAGILASIMSTADSQLLAAASSVSEDLLKDKFGFKLNAKKTMLIARLTVVAISAISVLIALNPDSNVFNIVSFAWAGFGAAFGPVVLFALFWKRTTRQGALAGMISGAAVIFIWKFIVRPLGGIWNIYELLPAFIVACAAILIVSLCTPAPDKEIVREFDQVAAMKG